MRDLVSIIVPIYNVEQYLPQTIESVLEQTYSNFELILVDDGSPDRCPEICDKYAAEDSRIIVIHQPNGGVTRARKTGVEKSKGNWILFVDGDDELKQNAIEFFLKQAIDNDVEMVISPEIKKRGNMIIQSKFYVEGRMSQREFCKNLSLQFFNIGIGGKFWSKKLYYDGVLDASNEIKNNEDCLMNLRLSKYMHSAYCNAHEGVYIVNVRDDSASHTQLNKGAWFVLYNELLNCASNYYYYPYVFLMGSMEQRLREKEIGVKDVKYYAKHIKLPKDVPFYIRVMRLYQKTFNPLYCFIFKFLRKKYRKKAVYQLYNV